MEINMPNNKYLMESEEETLRLELKTDVNIVQEQAVWAGLKSGMRVADLGCGPGLTTSALHKLVTPNGEAIGVDFSEQRCKYAESNYKVNGIEFICRDIRKPLKDLGLFDFIWVRFVLEYYLNDSFDIVKNIYKILKPGGILCLIDLDHNCLNHYGIPQKLERTIFKISDELQIKANFDPYVGRKLYSFLYDLNLKNIGVDIKAHHNIYGKLNKNDEFNFLKKIEIAPQKIKFNFEDYNNYLEFINETRDAFRNERRFTYTPIILCKGVKPSS
jgi:ubiquinone/menaquinone biosynthesis C-methylase UbiE